MRIFLMLTPLLAGVQERHLPAPSQADDPKAPAAAKDATPELLRPYLEYAKGLKGREHEVTRTVALSLGAAVERDHLAPDQIYAAQESRLNWKYIVKEELQRTEKAEPGALFGGCLYYDPGVPQKGDDPKTARDPEFRMQPIQDVDALLDRRRLVAALREGSAAPSEADAGRLKALLVTAANDAEIEDVEHVALLLQAHELLAAIAEGRVEEIGARWDAQLDQTSSGGLRWSQQRERVADAAEAALVAPLRASLPEGVTRDRAFQDFGDYVLQIVDPEDSEWAAHPSIVDANAADHAPTTVIQVTPRKRVTHKAKYPRARIGVVAGGTYRAPFDGRWPLRGRG